jgi:hypothetical protein
MVGARDWIMNDSADWASFNQPDYDTAWLQALGYTGDHPNAGVGPDNQDWAPNTGFQDWMDQQGITLGMGTKADPNPGTHASNLGRLQAFKDGDVYGPEHNWSLNENDPGFQAAMTLASAMFGGGMGNLAAAGMGATSGGLLAGAAAGAGGGFMGAASQGAWGSDLLKAAGYGALSGGFANGIDAAGALGVSDPTWAKPINSAVGAGTKAALTGGDIKDSVLGSLTSSGLGMGMNALYSGASNMFGDNGGGMNNLPSVDDYSSGFGDYQAPQPSWQTALGMGGTSSPAAGQGYGLEQYGFQPQGMGNASFVSPDMPSPYEGQNMTGNGVDPTTYQPKSSTGGNPFMQRFMPQSAGAAGGPGRFDNMAGNLMGLYSAYRNRKMAGKQAGQLQSLYSPNSPYAKQLEQTLLRSDAKAGRRSQVGPRSVELQARLAGLNAQMAPQLQSLYNQKGAAGDQMLMNLLAMGRNGGLQNMLGGLGNYFGGGGGNQFGLMGANPTFDYNYQNGSDLG